jgi:hypothetical protein
VELSVKRRKDEFPESAIRIERRMGMAAAGEPDCLFSHNAPLRELRAHYGRHLLFPAFEKTLSPLIRSYSTAGIQEQASSATSSRGPPSPLDGHKLSANDAGLDGMPCYIGEFHDESMR